MRSSKRFVYTRLSVFDFARMDIAIVESRISESWGPLTALFYEISGFGRKHKAWNTIGAPSTAVIRTCKYTRHDERNAAPSTVCLSMAYIIPEGPPSCITRGHRFWDTGKSRMHLLLEGSGHL